MRRTLLPDNLNGVANDPDVRPWLKGDPGPLDLTDTIATPANYAFEVEGGGFICINKGNGIYEVHSLFSKATRRLSLKTMQESMDYMFTRTDCETLVSHFPDDNPMADAIGRKGGFKFVQRLDNGPFAPCEIRAVLIDDWIASNASLEAHGERFHEALAAAKKATGSELPIHEHDAMHERFVGASLLMTERGNVTKGVRIYNRWAIENGYAVINLLSVVPPVVDVVDGIVTFDSCGLSVLTIR